jgi:hypothetical protein
LKGGQKDVATTSTDRAVAADETPGAGAAACALSEVLAENGFRKVGSLVSTNEDEGRVMITLSAGETRQLAALIVEGRK